MQLVVCSDLVEFQLTLSLSLSLVFLLLKSGFCQSANVQLSRNNAAWLQAVGSRHGRRFRRSARIHGSEICGKEYRAEERTGELYAKCARSTRASRQAMRGHTRFMHSAQFRVDIQRLVFGSGDVSL